MDETDFCGCLSFKQNETNKNKIRVLCFKFWFLYSRSSHFSTNKQTNKQTQSTWLFYVHTPPAHAVQFSQFSQRQPRSFSKKGHQDPGRRRHQSSSLTHAWVPGEPSTGVLRHRATSTMSQASRHCRSTPVAYTFRTRVRARVTCSVYNYIHLPTPPLSLSLDLSISLSHAHSQGHAADSPTR